MAKRYKTKKVFSWNVLFLELLAACEALGVSSSNKLLSVLVKARHPMMYSPGGEKSF
jgi:hypothetical protein